MKKLRKLQFLPFPAQSVLFPLYYIVHPSCQSNWPTCTAAPVLFLFFCNCKVMMSLKIFKKESCWQNLPQMPLLCSQVSQLPVSRCCPHQKRWTHQYQYMRAPGQCCLKHKQTIWNCQGFYGCVLGITGGGWQRIKVFQGLLGGLICAVSFFVSYQKLSRKENPIWEKN